jgi:hypothetical protein
VENGRKAVPHEMARNFGRARAALIAAPHRGEFLFAEAGQPPRIVVERRLQPRRLVAPGEHLVVRHRIEPGAFA